ncbi:hypothetical protein [Streptomyces sp. NBC_00996]|uniref:hypothetical protein n=1 Tax=Streptomyces sp. NBC_00996 TaxID=2903710 RepID=UPI00386B6763|nr:hypothetical protein OG390_25050 [Streptomyces sp. NBC_00996]
MGHTPSERARILEGLHIKAVRQQHRTQDLAHQPGSGIDPLARAGHWEERIEEINAHWEQADQAWRDARTQAGPYPTPGEAARIAILLGERDRLNAEYSRARDLRDQAIDEAEAHYRLRGW